MAILEAQKESINDWIKDNTSKAPNTELSVSDLYCAYVNSLVRASSSIVAPTPRTFSKFVKLYLKDDIEALQIRYYYRPKGTIKGLSLK